MGGLGPQWTGALYRDPKGVHYSKRIAAIVLRVAVAEKIEFEKIISAPSGGKSGMGQAPCYLRK